MRVIQCHPGELAVLETARCQGCEHVFDKVVLDDGSDVMLPVAIPRDCIRGNTFQCKYCGEDALLVVVRYRDFIAC